MITELSRIISGTYDYANTQINFDSPPYLLANNKLILYFTNNDSKFTAHVVSVNANNAVVDFNNQQYANAHVVAHTTAYNNGLTGPQDIFSWKFSTPPNAILQINSNGGSSNVAIEASTDQIHWTALANLAITEANANTGFFNVTSPWPYGRLNLWDIASGKTITGNKVI